uniref:Uncharacterized protein n=1 Tax=Parascaris equorum TaxID=6256 RepID=A0A914S2Q8_PAREQ
MHRVKQSLHYLSLKIIGNPINDSQRGMGKKLGSLAFLVQSAQLQK